MIKINNETIVRFNDLMAEQGLKEVEFSYYEQSFGNYIFIFENKFLRFRLSSDKGEENIDIQQILDPDDWFDFQIVYCFLETKEVLTEPIEIENQLAYIGKNFSKIAGLFRDEVYETTKLSLSKLRKERARQMFPGNFLD